MEVRAESLRGRLFGARPGTWAVASVLCLAAIETLWSLLSPRLAPTEADWKRAAGLVRAHYRAGDLLVAAPTWADPLLRTYLGDLIPIPVAARMDDARYGRVWEIGQRGAHADEARGAVALDEPAGRLRVRLLERPAAPVHYDFVERWRDAEVVRWDLGSRTPTRCHPNVRGDGVACVGNDLAVSQALVEVDTRIRRAILAPPEAGALLAVEYPAVALGKELAVRTGLHDVWARKYATGTVYLKVLIDDRPVLEVVTGNRSGWLASRADTRAWEGKTARVRFEISSAAPALRHFAFAAESRG